MTVEDLLKEALIEIAELRHENRQLVVKLLYYMRATTAVERSRAVTRLRSEGITATLRRGIG